MPFLRILIVVFLCSAFSSGCGLLSGTKRLKPEEEILQQKSEHFEKLRQDIIGGKLLTGIHSAELRRLYGEPDDIYLSSSSISRLEIWTYERILIPKTDANWQPIRLYLDNDKLITWKY